MNRSQQESLRKLLDYCKSAAYPAGPLSMDDDFKSKDNVVSKYANHTIQLKYVHMYAAKLIACMAHVRRSHAATFDKGERIVSVGAGPCFCLLGWCLPFGRKEQELRGYDPLDWNGVRASRQFAEVVTAFCGGHLQYKGGHYFPTGTKPPQCRAQRALVAIDPGDFRATDIVLLPFVLNHLVGEGAPHPDARAVFDWITQVRGRVAAMAVTDMELIPGTATKNSTRAFWQRVTSGLGARELPARFTFTSQAKELAACYSEGAARRAHSSMTAASGLWTAKSTNCWQPIA